MKRSILKISFVVLLVAGCSEETPSDPVAPAYVLSREQYTDLLTNLALTESVYTTNFLNLSGPKFDSVYNFNVLHEMGITRAQYDSSIVFYNRYPKLHKEIHDEVLMKLSEMMAKASPGTLKDSAAKPPAPGQY